MPTNAGRGFIRPGDRGCTHRRATPKPKLATSKTSLFGRAETRTHGDMVVQIECHTHILPCPGVWEIAMSGSLRACRYSQIRVSGHCRLLGAVPSGTHSHTTREPLPRVRVHVKAESFHPTTSHEITHDVENGSTVRPPIPDLHPGLDSHHTPITFSHLTFGNS